jgi:hypothetical protein
MSGVASERPRYARTETHQKLIMFPRSGLPTGSTHLVENFKIHTTHSPINQLH